MNRNDFKIVKEGKGAFYVYYYAPHWFFWKKWKPAFSYTDPRFGGDGYDFSTEEEAEQAIQSRYLGRRNDQ